jgi:hypothetical protein
MVFNEKLASVFVCHREENLCELYRASNLASRDIRLRAAVAIILRKWNRRRGGGITPVSACEAAQSGKLRPIVCVRLNFGHSSPPVVLKKLHTQTLSLEGGER